MNNKISNLLQNNGGNYILPFLWMHGEEEQVLRKYMKAIQECNIGAVCVESRPHPDYVGPGWWKDMDVILDEARKRCMKVWILDDSHFPTGYVNGALESADSELCRQSLVYQIINSPEAGEILELSMDNYKNATPWQQNMIETYLLNSQQMRQYEDEQLISVVALKVNGSCEEDIIDLSTHISDGTLRFKVPEGEWKVYICHLTRNRGPHRNYINMMNAESCKILLDNVYESHYQHYADDFGMTIAGFFSDEPELGNGHLYEYGKRIYEMEDQAWSSEIQVVLEEKWKNNFVKFLPLLWEQSFADDIKALVRYDYMNAITKAVEEDFSIQIGSWCRDHGVEYIGHLIEDNNQHTRTGSSMGHFFRGLAGQDMAGIDDIGGQVFPQGEGDGPTGPMGEERDGEFYHYALGKLGASLASIDPLKKGRAMCEIFGNYGWEEGVKLEKYLVDHFLVRGINHYVPHAFSAKEYPDPDCPPHFYANGNDPLYRHFRNLMKYVNRVCELTNDGYHVAPVAILYHAEAEWTGEYMYIQKPAKKLADRQIDYDFIPVDVFTEAKKYKTELGKCLKVNQQEYKALIIPEAQYITSALAKAIKELMNKECMVAFINRFPVGICDGSNASLEDINNCKVILLDELTAELDKLLIPEIMLTPANDRIRYMHYRQESDIYLFVNEGKEAYHGVINVPQTGACYVYNAWDNNLEKITLAESASGTSLSVVLEPTKSLIIIFDDTDIKLQDPVMTEGSELPWNNGWKRSICRSINYPAFEQEKDISLPDNLGKEEPDFSGFVCYKKEYECLEVPERLILEITDAKEGVELWVNGVNAGIQIVAPFRYDVTDLIKSGTNQIRIEVATTLEREMSRIQDMIRIERGLGKKEIECPSGINGGVLWRVPTSH